MATWLHVASFRTAVVGVASQRLLGGGVLVVPPELISWLSLVREVWWLMRSAVGVLVLRLGVRSSRRDLV